MKTRCTPGSGNGATAPGSKPVASRTRAGAATRARPQVARHHDDDRPAVAVDDERLHDLGERAAGGRRRVLSGRRAQLELLPARLRPHGTQVPRDALDCLGPHGRYSSEMNRASSKPSA